MTKTDIRILKATQTVFPDSKLIISNAKQEDIDKLKQAGIKGVLKQMNKEIKRKINSLAKLFYDSMGYEVKEGYDFSGATHPQEKGLWNQALIAWCFIKQETELLKYQL